MTDSDDEPTKPEGPAPEPEPVDDDARKHARIAAMLGRPEGEEQSPLWQRRVLETLGLGEVRIHVLVYGLPLCRFSLDAPARWPIGEIWIRRSQYTETSAACSDPEHELHSVQRFKMCEGCASVVESKHALKVADLPDPPITADLPVVPSLVLKAYGTMPRFADLGDRLRALVGGDTQLDERLGRALIDAELDGTVAEFYALCFHAIVVAIVSLDDAYHYLAMAEREARTEPERAIIEGARAIFDRRRAGAPS